MFGPLNESLLKKAQEKGLLQINIVDIREKTKDKHKTADDKTFGGGPGMVMMIEPILENINELKTKSTKIILMSPCGQKLTQKKAESLSNETHLIIICGHYEGIDERINNEIDEEISIGDYILTGGELSAMVIVDAVSRFIQGVVKEKESVQTDSFSDGILDFPHYTRPAHAGSHNVPKILMSGDHEEIRKWRRRESLRRTLFCRPDLFPEADLSEEDKGFIEDIVLGKH